MRVKADNQDAAKEKAAHLLDEAEKKRAAIRFERGLLELENGRFTVIKNPEFAEKISEYLYENLALNQSEKASILIEKLFFQFGNGDPEDDKIILSILGNVCSLGLKSSNIRLLKLLCVNFSEVIANQHYEILLSVEICQFLAKSAVIFVRSSQWSDFENLLTVLWGIRSISFDTSAGPVEPVPDILSDMATNDAIEKILQ